MCVHAHSYTHTYIHMYKTEKVQALGMVLSKRNTEAGCLWFPCSCMSFWHFFSTLIHFTLTYIFGYLLFRMHYSTNHKYNNQKEQERGKKGKIMQSLLSWWSECDRRWILQAQQKTRHGHLLTHPLKIRTWQCSKEEWQIPSWVGMGTAKRFCWGMQHMGCIWRCRGIDTAGRECSIHVIEACDGKTPGTSGLSPWSVI